MHGANELALFGLGLAPQLVRWFVWFGLVALTAALLVLMRTPWGQSNPLRKCAVLSLVVHLLVGIYATTVHIVTGGGSGGGDGQGIAVSLVDDPEGETMVAPTEVGGESWAVDNDPLAADLDAATAGSDEDRALEPPREAVQDPAQPDRSAPTPEPSPDIGPEVPHTALHDRAAAETVEPAPAEDERPNSAAQEPTAEPALAMDVGPPEPDALAAHDQTPPLKPLRNVDRSADSAEPSLPDRTAEVAPAPRADRLHGDGRMDERPFASRTLDGSQASASRPAHRLPREYQNRSADRLRVALGNGGTIDTERAVAAALGWLARQQSADGRWSSRALGGGAVSHPAIGDDSLRSSGAGGFADTGITGLALLAFLAAGHTHQTGEYRDTVADALEFLVGHQASNGSLAGDAKLYERMYCHAMATFALSEALGMTGDSRLEDPVRQAVRFSLSAQHADGGWRYTPGDPGDTSQLGWQLMALKSAELAGLPLPEASRQGMIRFLNRVARGERGGLACYRQGREPTPTMTAEALVCRHFLGLEANSPAAQEAVDHLMRDLPGSGSANVYYWYYGTLALFQVQGSAWERWNSALQKSLLGSQRTAGEHRGSWDADPTWGQYGGRAFNTALGCLCLEVYYRYLPLQVEAASRGGSVNSRATSR